MTVTPLPTTGNSSKFHIVTKSGEFSIAMSHTLRTTIWALKDEAEELHAAKELAEAIVSRHDPLLPFRRVYIFAPHNTDQSLDLVISKIRKHGFLNQTSKNIY